MALALFCLHFCLPFPLISLPTLPLLLEFPAASGLSVPTNKNYFSAIKSHFQASSIPVLPFLSPHLALAISSLEKNSPSSFPTKPIFSPSQLIAHFFCLSSLPLHAHYHVAFSFSFLVMLRISNIAPSSSSSSLAGGCLSFF
jgi:hypothetical protein